MISKTVNQIKKTGQSVWYDDLSRELILSGKLEKLVQRGITGVTSNPSIFNKAISSGNEYDPSLIKLSQKKFNIEEIYESLTIEDIKNAAEILKPVYHQTNMQDGYVSLEVNPHFSNDISSTITEAKKLFDILNQQNVMIKIPATDEGIESVEYLISEGVNVNITLIFSLEKYKKVRNAYIKGLTKRLESGRKINEIASVASFFISRVDTKIDPLIESNNNLSQTQKNKLLGTIAISNAIVAYKDFIRDFSSEKFEKLKENGAMVQKPLWASTSTKNPKYSATYYVENLCMKNTINTMPKDTFESTEKGSLKSVKSSQNNSENNIDLLQNNNINLDNITQELLDDGIKLFEDSYDELKKNISQKLNYLNS